MGDEAKVRKALEKEFRQPFTKKRLQVGYLVNGQPAYKEFDWVSQYDKVVVMVKDYSAKNLAGNQTRHARVMRDLYYLSLVAAVRRFMYLSADFYQWFVSQPDAAIAKGIELRIDC